MAAHGGAPVPDPPFTALEMFVCTYEVTLDNIQRMSHRELIGRLEPRGAVKALDCNYGHKVLPGSGLAPKAPPPPRQPLDGNEAPVRTRKPQGDASCFNSALEVKIVPGPEDAPPPGVLEYAERRRIVKRYALKTFPSTGKTQVPGVICPGLEDGEYVAGLWARHLTESGIAADPARPVAVRDGRPIMLNFKFALRNRSGREENFNLAAVVERLAADKAAGGGPDLPYPIREIKPVQDGQNNIAFKLVGTREKKVRVNLFRGGKVNVLGAIDFEVPRAAYAYLSRLLARDWDRFVDVIPEPDFPEALRRPRGATARRRLAAEAAAAPEDPLPRASPAPLRRGAPGDAAAPPLDAGLARLGALGALGALDSERAQCLRAEAALWGAETALWGARAALWGAEAALRGSNDPLVDKARGEDEEEHDEHALHDDAE
jgi:hypothetical protein